MCNLDLSDLIKFRSKFIDLSHRIIDDIFMLSGKISCWPNAITFRHEIIMINLMGLNSIKTSSN